MPTISCWLFCQSESSPTSNLQGFKPLIKLRWSSCQMAQAFPLWAWCSWDQRWMWLKRKENLLKATILGAWRTRGCAWHTHLPSSVLWTASGGGTESRELRSGFGGKQHQTSEMRVPGLKEALRGWEFLRMLGVLVTVPCQESGYSRPLRLKSETAQHRWPVIIRQQTQGKSCPFLSLCNFSPVF